MPPILKNKKVIILIAGFAIVALALLIFGGSDSSAERSSPAAPYLSVAPSSDANADAALGGDLLAALALLRTIQLDTSVFVDPIFKSLSDWGKKIACDYRRSRQTQLIQYGLFWTLRMWRARMG